MTDSKYGLISAESHVVEPADLFSSRLPAGLKDKAPRPAADGAGLGHPGLRRSGAAPHGVRGRRLPAFGA